MKYTKIFVILALLIVFLLCCICSCSKNNTTDRIKITDRMFHSFEIKDGFVYFDCELTLVNRTNEDISFMLLVENNEDHKRGLLRSPNMYAANQDGIPEVFFLEAHSHIDTRIQFAGKHGNASTKYDRLMPEEIICIELAVP